MADINDLDWVLVGDEKYEKATTTIGGVEVVITKYDDDSYVVTNGENGHEISFSMLEKMIGEDKISWKKPNIEEISREINFNKVSKILSPDSWKSVSGVGEKVLEIPHAAEPGGTLRLIKMNEDSYKAAVIGIPPNDGKEIRYAELDLYTTLMNYSAALGLGSKIGEEYYEKMKAASETTDYEIIE